MLGETNGPGGEHELWFLRCHRPDGEDDWELLAGDWPSFGRGQKSHFHPQLMLDRRNILLVAGDPDLGHNQMFLLDVADLPDSEGIGPLRH